MDKPLLHLSYSLGDITTAAAALWQVAAPYPILAFSGEMGAGKTTFISHLCRHLQIEDAVSSPTFALINEYRLPAAGSQRNTIFHIDLYRLRDADEAINAGVEDCIIQAANGAAWCLIEWPEKATELLRKPYLWLSIENTDAYNRIMTVTVVS